MASTAVKETQDVAMKFEESTGSETSKSTPQHDGQGATPARPITKEREAGWGDYFR